MRQLYKKLLIFTLLLLETFGAFAFGFEKNSGQVIDEFRNQRKEVLFMHNEAGLSVQLRENGFSYQFQSIKEDNINEKNEPCKLDYHRVDINFIEMSKKAKVLGKNFQFQNTFYGEKSSKYVSDVVTEVYYSNVYDGVDFQFISDKSGFKYNIICSDNAALQRVRLRYDGLLGPLELSQDGNIVLKTGFGLAKEDIPTSLRCFESDSVPCKVTPIISNAGNEVLFHFPEILKEGETLIIDPIPFLLWSTYSGGTGNDEIHQVDIDLDGNIYTSGFTTSSLNIATSGAFQGTLQGFQNCFLMKHNPQGQKIFGTYFGGQSSDRCYGMLHDDESGHIYLSGSTFSSGIATLGTHQTELSSPDDGLIVKFDLTGNLVWATYYGGSDHDYIAEMALDSYGDILMTGHTRSTNNIATDNTFLPGNENTFVAKFSSTGLHLWGTYYGGSFDEGWGIDLDNENNIYISGITSSISGISTPGAHQLALSGGRDAFLAKFDPNGQLLWGTYYGGVNDDKSTGLRVDSDGSILIFGNTSSSGGISTTGSYQPVMGSIDDAFLSKFSPSGSLVWGTYVGGEGVDYLYGMRLKPDGKILLAGMSESLNSVVSPNAFQNSPSGEYDALLMQFNSNGQFEWGSYLGGALIDFANDVAIDSYLGHIVIAGMTRSTTGISSIGATSENYSGGLYDGFISRFCIPPLPEITAQNGLIVCDNSPIGFSLNQDFSAINWNLGGFSSTYSFVPSEIGQQDIFVDVEDNTGCPARSDTLTVQVFATPELPFTIESNPQGIVCLGLPIELTILPTYATQLWWNGGTETQTQILLTDTLEQYATATVFDANGCCHTDSILIQAQLCTEVTNIKSDDEILIYPNPSMGTFHISWKVSNNPFTITLFQIDGREVYRGIAEQNMSVKTNLTSGVYILQLENNDKSSCHRQLVEFIK